MSGDDGHVGGESAVLLVSHGGVDDLGDLEAFVTRVRRGRTPSPELVAELRRRYTAIGGSPFNAINAELSARLRSRLGQRVATANRLSAPFVRDVVARLRDEGVRRLAVVPLAQHSTHVYAADACSAAEGFGLDVRCASAWGRVPALSQAFAARIVAALGALPPGEPATVIMTAHSLPKSVVDGGDPYEREVRGSFDDVAAIVRSRVDGAPPLVLAFQSQGMSGAGERPVPWLGPDLPATIEKAADVGARHVVFAPIGFLADHVEVLYDLDVEARALAAARGLGYARAASLNADDDLVQVLAAVAAPLLAHG
jgi:ferrochelatase